MLHEFAGRVAVVTGAGGGIGTALCRGLAAEGARIVVADIDGSAARRTADGLGEAHAVQVDVSDPESFAAFADEAFSAFGHVDIVCNNAGVWQGGLSWHRSRADWEWVIGVNLYGIIHAISNFVPRMIEQDTEGHIVNTSSIAAFVTGPYISPYAVSKSAAFALSECLARDLDAVGSKIGVSVLTPSAIDTDIAHAARVRPDRYGIDETKDAFAMVEFLAATTASGISPDECVGPVIQAIRNGEFLIPTRPSYVDQLRGRADDLVARRLPSVPAVD